MKRCFLLFTLQQPVVRMDIEERCPAKLFQWHSFSPWHNLSKLSSAHGLPKELFIVVNVVFVFFPPQQAISERERARWQGSFRSYGEFPLVGAVGGWPVGSPWGSSSSLTQGGWQGQRLVQTWLQEPWLQADVLLLVGP